MFAYVGLEVWHWILNTIVKLERSDHLIRIVAALFISWKNALRDVPNGLELIIKKRKMEAVRILILSAGFVNSKSDEEVIIKQN